MGDSVGVADGGADGNEEGLAVGLLEGWKDGMAVVVVDVGSLGITVGLRVGSTEKYQKRKEKVINERSISD